MAKCRICRHYWRHLVKHHGYADRSRCHVPKSHHRQPSVSSAAMANPAQLQARAGLRRQAPSSATRTATHSESQQYFQVHYTKEKLEEYIKPDGNTLKVRLANINLRTNCRIMLGTDKRATITTNWSEFHRRANIHEGRICTFPFKVTAEHRLALIVHVL
ncbi:hypothetical protein VPH35_077702 [Triticum aestivum]